LDCSLRLAFRGFPIVHLWSNPVSGFHGFGLGITGLVSVDDGNERL
jgi:hypothetical protein